MSKTIEQRIDAVEYENFCGYMTFIRNLSNAAKQHYREDPETFDLSVWTQKMLEESPYGHCIIVWHLKRWYCLEEHGYDPYYKGNSDELVEIDYNKEVDGVGTKTADNIVDFIEDNNIRTKRQLLTELRASMDSVYGLGEQNMTNLEDYFDLPDNPDDDGDDAGIPSDNEPDAQETSGDASRDVLSFDYTAIKGLGPSTESNIHAFIKEHGIEDMSTLLDKLGENLDDVSRLGPTTLDRLRKKVEEL